MSAVIVDAGLGNLCSVVKGLERVGLRAEITSNGERIRKADGLVVPGQGAFGAFMEGLERRGARDAVLEAIQRGKPYLGICLGLQVLFEESEEHGPVKGLGVLPGSVRRFQPPEHQKLNVPHIGWNQVQIIKESPFLKGISTGDYFYFVHSYYVVPENRDLVCMTTDYGVRFASAICTEKLFGCQFHPEKSQALGLTILRNFVSLSSLR